MPQKTFDTEYWGKKDTHKKSGIPIIQRSGRNNNDPVMTMPLRTQGLAQQQILLLWHDFPFHAVPVNLGNQHISHLIMKIFARNVNLHIIGGMSCVISILFVLK